MKYFKGKRGADGTYKFFLSRAGGITFQIGIRLTVEIDPATTVLNDDPNGFGGGRRIGAEITGGYELRALGYLPPLR